jgi:hypothetical protein
MTWKPIMIGFDGAVEATEPPPSAVMCDWCHHYWHGAVCTDGYGDQTCRCDSSLERRDDCWRPKLASEDSIRTISHDTGCDGWAATYCVRYQSSYPGRANVLRRAIYHA